MLAYDVVTQIVETIYHLQVYRIEPIPPVFDWRAIYRIHDTQGRVWLLRMFRLPQAAQALTETARLLQWLKQQGYPAPQPVTTRDNHLIGQLTGQLDGWACLLLSYIDGSVLDVHSTDFELLGYALGRLHALPVTSITPASHSRCHPDTCQAQTMRQLAWGKDNGAAVVQPLAAALYHSLTPIAGCFDELRITHGDCWYTNAIKTPDQGVVLIDWDCAGIGLPILDLGYLLLTSHYDLTQPLQIAADTDKIHAILHGYQQVRPITRSACALMESAVRFTLAFHLGDYLEEHADVEIEADDIVLQKMLARFAATTHIAHIATTYLEQEREAS